jgi:hypothetical protein
MKPIAQETAFWSIASVRLFLDDVEQLLDILRGSGQPVRIIHDNYEYDSLAELAEKQGASIDQVKLRCDRGLSVEIGQHVYVYVSTDYKSIGYEAAEVLRSRVRWVEAVPSLVIIPLGVLVPIAGAAAIMFVSRHAGFRPSVQFFAGIGAGAVLWILTILAMQSRSRILLTRRHERRAAWTAHRRDILLVIVTTIITALVTWLVSRVLPGKP